jgi:hypothetical protein
MIVNHSVEDSDLGKVNGFGQTLAAISRSVGPALGGAMWSISLQYDFTFGNFILTALILLVCQWMNSQMPSSLDYKLGHSENSENSESEENQQVIH